MTSRTIINAHTSTPAQSTTDSVSSYDGRQRPLISFCLFAYNQEQFIREAVKGALAQNYSPLEIILSDDCSTDDTFSIMEQMANKYEGAHKIILNRNDKNLGLVPHVNKVFGKMAQGDLIVAAAGDDISLPERTKKLWVAWERTDRKAKLIASGRLHIDSAGKTIGEWLPYSPGLDARDIIEFILNPHGNFSGATAMYHRDVFNVFGPLVFAEVEDGALIIRSRILGPVFTVSDKLVKYRISAMNLTGFLDLDYKEKMIRVNSWRILTYDQIINDLTNHKVAKLFQRDEVCAIVKACHKHRKKHELLISLTNRPLIVRIVIWLRLLSVLSVSKSIDNLVYLFPSIFYSRLMKYGLPSDSRLWKWLCSFKRRLLSFFKTEY